MKATNVFDVATVGLLLVGMSSCATQQSVDQLEKRVAALEEKQKIKETELRDRREKLETCVTQDADAVYWDYVRLNGKPASGKADVYSAPQYVWNSAERQKKDKIDNASFFTALAR